MAVAWEFLVIKERAMESEILEQIIEEYGDNINITDIFSMDDWKWSNQQRLKDIAEINERLDEGKIITVEMQSEKWKSLGLYAEKGKAYLYTFWMNTEGHPEIDSDQITDANKQYYCQAYSILDKLIQKYKFSFNYIAIGLESDIRYGEDIGKTILDSRNVIVWLMEDGNNTVLPKNLVRNKVSEELDSITAGI